MSKTPIITLSVCLAAGLAFGIGLARPGGETIAIAAEADAQTPSATSVPQTEPGATNGYGESPVEEAAVATPQGAASAGALSGSVTIEAFDFGAPIAVGRGASITVTNVDGVAHTLTASDGQFDTGNIGGGASASLTAPSASGSYAFLCQIHPSMTGTLSVTG